MESFTTNHSAWRIIAHEGVVETFIDSEGKERSIFYFNRHGIIRAYPLHSPLNENTKFQQMLPGFSPWDLVEGLSHA